jgi:hypothetical protein
MNKRTIILAMTLAASLQSLAHAAYTRATSPPLTITQVYANEYGSPFVYVSGALNSACSGGNGLYLYDITQSQPNWSYRNNKMAMLLSAQASGGQVVLDYYYDPTVAGWAACYIEGIQLVN